MRCEEAQPLIDGYLDGQLDLVRNLDLERHLETCPDCAPVRQSALELRSAIRAGVPYLRAPQSLRRRVRAVLPQDPRARSRAAVLTWRWLAAAAAVVLLVLGSARLETAWLGSSHDDLVAQEIVASHIRSLMANHLSDVTSTDQHTVKPWFDGKLDFAPPVADLASSGFPLVGGRLDYVDGRPVAALVYKRRLHYINVFIWPSAGPQATPVVSQARQGYNLFHWSQGGMTYWAVTDATADDLQGFVALLRK